MTTNLHFNESEMEWKWNTQNTWLTIQMKLILSLWHANNTYNFNNHLCGSFAGLLRLVHIKTLFIDAYDIFTRCKNNEYLLT